MSLLNEGSDSKFLTENGTLLMINQTQIKIEEMKLSITQKH